MNREARRRAATDRILRLFRAALDKYRLTPLVLLAGCDRTGDLKVIHPPGMTAETARALLRSGAAMVRKSHDAEMVQLPQPEEGGGQ